LNPLVCGPVFWKKGPSFPPSNPEFPVCRRGNRLGKKKLRGPSDFKGSVFQHKKPFRGPIRGGGFLGRRAFRSSRMNSQGTPKDLAKRRGGRTEGFRRGPADRGKPVIFPTPKKTVFLASFQVFDPRGHYGAQGFRKIHSAGFKLCFVKTQGGGNGVSLDIGGSTLWDGGDLSGGGRAKKQKPFFPLISGPHLLLVGRNGGCFGGNTRGLATGRRHHFSGHWWSPCLTGAWQKGPFQHFFLIGTQRFLFLRPIFCFRGALRGSAGGNRGHGGTHFVGPA